MSGKGTPNTPRGTPSGTKTPSLPPPPPTPPPSARMSTGATPTVSKRGGICEHGPFVGGGLVGTGDKIGDDDLGLAKSFGQVRGHTKADIKRHRNGSSQRSKCDECGRFHKGKCWGKQFEYHMDKKKKKKRNGKSNGKSNRSGSGSGSDDASESNDSSKSDETKRTERMRTIEKMLLATVPAEDDPDPSFVDSGGRQWRYNRDRKKWEQQTNASGMAACNTTKRKVYADEFDADVEFAGIALMVAVDTADLPALDKSCHASGNANGVQVDFTEFDRSTLSFMEGEDCGEPQDDSEGQEEEVYGVDARVDVPGSYAKVVDPFEYDTDEHDSDAASSANVVEDDFTRFDRPTLTFMEGEDCGEPQGDSEGQEVIVDVDENEDDDSSVETTGLVDERLDEISTVGPVEAMKETDDGEVLKESTGCADQSAPTGTLGDDLLLENDPVAEAKSHSSLFQSDFTQSDHSTLTFMEGEDCGGPQDDSEGQGDDDADADADDDDDDDDVDDVDDDDGVCRVEEPTYRLGFAFYSVDLKEAWKYQAGLETLSWAYLIWWIRIMCAAFWTIMRPLDVLWDGIEVPLHTIATYAWTNMVDWSEIEPGEKRRRPLDAATDWSEIEPGEKHECSAGFLRAQMIVLMFLVVTVGSGLFLALFDRRADFVGSMTKMDQVMRFHGLANSVRIEGADTVHLDVQSDVMFHLELGDASSAVPSIGKEKEPPTCLEHYCIDRDIVDGCRVLVDGEPTFDETWSVKVESNSQIDMTKTNRTLDMDVLTEGAQPPMMATKSESMMRAVLIKGATATPPDVRIEGAQTVGSDATSDEDYGFENHTVTGVDGVEHDRKSRIGYERLMAWLWMWVSTSSPLRDILEEIHDDVSDEGAKIRYLTPKHTTRTQKEIEDRFRQTMEERERNIKSITTPLEFADGFLTLVGEESFPTVREQRLDWQGFLTLVGEESFPTVREQAMDW